VREAVPGGPVLQQQPGDQRRLDGLEQLLLLCQGGHVLGQVEVELPAQDGARAQQAERLLGQAVQAAPHDVAHALGHLEGRDHGRTSEAVVQQPRELRDVEGVAVGPLVHRDRHVRRRGGTCADREQLPHLGVAEPDEVQAERLQPGHHRKRLGQRRADVGRCVAVRPDEQDLGVLQLAADVLQQAQAVDVGPVQVVEHHQQRPRPRRGPEQLRDGVVEAEARGLVVGSSSPELGQDVGEVGASGLDELCGRERTSARSTAAQGQNGGDVAPSWLRPHATGTPAAAARAASTSSSRVLPIPGSPLTRATRPPAEASASACSSSPTCCPRPTSTGGAGALGAGTTTAGRTDRLGSCASTSCSSRCRAGPGSSPSSSASSARARRSASSASACRCAP
jgi:hypothetical protein